MSRHVVLCALLATSSTKRCPACCCHERMPLDAPVRTARRAVARSLQDARCIGSRHSMRSTGVPMAPMRRLLWDVRRSPSHGSSSSPRSCLATYEHTCKHVTLDGNHSDQKQRECNAASSGFHESRDTCHECMEVSTANTQNHPCGYPVAAVKIPSSRTHEKSSVA